MKRRMWQIIENAANTEEKMASTAQSRRNRAEVKSKMSFAEKFSQLHLNSQALQDEVRRLNERVNSASPSQASAPQAVLPTTVNRFSEMTIRREFKISG